MIIQCEKCHAKFRLDDSKIPDQGRKVRCSKCQHVFWVRKAAAPPPPPPPPPPPLPPKEEDLDIKLDEEDAARMSEEPTEAPQPTSREPEETFEPTVRIDLGAHEELAYEEEKEPAVPPPPRRKGKLVKALVGVVAVLVLLGVVGVVLHQFDLLPFLSSSPPEAPTANLEVDHAKLDGKWEKNAQVPRIFVINGVLQNVSKKPRAFVKIQGLLLDRDSKTVKEVSAFCGNPIPEQDLRTKAPAEIQEAMKKREGQKGINRNIPPGGTVPFTVVFFDIPDGVESFAVKVLEAQVPGPS